MFEDWVVVTCGVIVVIIVAAVALLLSDQLFVDRLLGQPEDLPNAIVEPLGVVDQAGVEFDLQVHGGPTAAIVVVGDLARDADVGFQRHIAVLSAE